MVQILAVKNDEPIDWSTNLRWFASSPPQRAVVAGTMPAKAAAVVKTWPVTLPVPTLTDRTQLPVIIDVDFPEKVGIDRLLHAVAANVIRQPQQPAIIVSSGTAITVEVVSSEGTFLGGAILPGILMGAKSLPPGNDRAAAVDPWKLLEYEPAILGKNTEAAIAVVLSGDVYGTVRELVDRYSEMLTKRSDPPLLLLTGGVGSDPRTTSHGSMGTGARTSGPGLGRDQFENDPCSRLFPVNSSVPFRLISVNPSSFRTRIHAEKPAAMGITSACQ